MVAYFSIEIRRLPDRTVFDLILFSLFVSYIGFLFIGLPFVWLLRKYGWFNGFSLCCGGAVLGGATMCLMNSAMRISTHQPSHVSWQECKSAASIGAGVGLAIAVVYGLISPKAKHAN
jgi:hypothetical protein